jgi:hypothetical protein
MRRAPRTRPWTRLIVPALALGLGLLAGACSSDQAPDDDAPSQGEPSAAPTLEVEPVTRLGQVTGQLPRKDAKAVEERVSTIAVRWLTDAYVGGSYPRDTFDNSFADFSRGARSAARTDLEVMSNADIGRRVEAVTPTRMDVEVDLLAVDKHPVGSTARVQTTFKAEGQKKGRYRVSGRLLLTKEDGRWTVFAYHVSKGGR